MSDDPIALRAYIAELAAQLAGLADEVDLTEAAELLRAASTIAHKATQKGEQNGIHH